MRQRAWAWRCAIAALVMAAGIEARAQAEAELEADAPRVFSIQPRPYRLGHEFQLGLGVLPLDAFYVGMLVNGSYTYHFSDFWAWEMASVGYSLNLDTGLTDELFEDFGALPEQDGGDRITLVGTTSLVVKPLFGKLAVFNSNKVYAETSFNFGLGPMRTAVGSRGTFFFSGLLGFGLRFWWSQAFSIRFDLRDYLVFKQAIPENALMFMFSASFNYYNPDEQVSAAAAPARLSSSSP